MVSHQLSLLSSSKPQFNAHLLDALRFSLLRQFYCSVQTSVTFPPVFLPVPPISRASLSPSPSFLAITLWFSQGFSSSIDGLTLQYSRYATRGYHNGNLAETSSTITIDDAASYEGVLDEENDGLRDVFRLTDAPSRCACRRLREEVIAEVFRERSSVMVLSYLFLPGVSLSGNERRYVHIFERKTLRFVT
jgi:hypothetical protein